MSESFKKKLEELSSPGKSGSDYRATATPENWRPRSEVGSDGGFAISSPRALGNSPSAEEILREHNLSPEDWTVTSARHGKWQTFDGEWLESSRVNIVPSNSTAPDFDLEKLVDEIKKWKPSGKSKNSLSGGAFVFAPSDQQIGKKAGEHGTEQSIQRLLAGTDRGVNRLLLLRQAGLDLSTVVIALPGDHVEGNVSQNGRLQGQASSDLGQTEQVRVARRLLMAQIKAFAEHSNKIIIPVVNGNHDEVTRQVVADPADGWNVEIASAVEDACMENSHLKDIVEFRYPASGHQTLAVEVEGVMLGLFHGHQFRGDVQKYLQGQALGNTAMGGCDVWISGHYHHYKAQDIGDRLWLQCPTTDPGSDWFRDRTGATSRPGVLSLVIGKNYDPREFIGVLPVE